MPTYEYSCRACGHLFEEIQKISEPPIDTCPKCGQKQAQRLISQGNFILKGGGWYTTGGYGTPSKGPSGGGDDGGGSSSSKTEPAKSETKTETKPDTGSTSGSGTKSSAAA
jgi:putative FmdB family regulatory protein